MSLSKPHKLSDGNTMRVRTRRTIAGTYYEEVHSLKGRPHACTLWRLGTAMFLIPGGVDRDYTPGRITNPDYSYARDDKHGAEVAMRFFVDGAESCIEEARKECLPTIAMYRLDWEQLTA
jgi:hypothetical protein